ncbi:MAG TPA: hypothetical protein VE934_03475 [Polaromonas sp.]|uniref:hypothetical protein n=1 Tax=Polaromonas sp. TaxID=1869339 RepID=UPI002D2F7DE8|nr:hypothetical protein [Polaromonas sp.]HYW55991.1 hypothetical protein [Polaromonas sp.]
MHNPPAVVYPLRRSRVSGLLLVATWLAGAVVFLLWWGTATVFDWRQSSAGAALVLGGVIAGWGWKNSPDGQLRWDGQVWCWQGPEGHASTPALELSVAIDFQQVLLLKLKNHDNAVCWLWVERQAQPERWMDLRRAVYSRRRATPLNPEPVPAFSTVELPVDASPPRPYS